MEMIQNFPIIELKAKAGYLSSHLSWSSMSKILFSKF